MVKITKIKLLRLFMKIAIGVVDNGLIFYGNAGHAPYFAIYELKGAGMFKSFTLEELRENPKMKGHEFEEDGKHTCKHDGDDEAHVSAHFKMADAIKDCDYMVLNRGCKNTMNAFKSEGIKVQKYTGDLSNAKEIVSSLANSFN
jgi:predicted Fe-Mo cluster-binding NifX family protein